MRIFISGLGLNGKTTLINKITSEHPEFRSFHIDTTDFMKSLPEGMDPDEKKLQLTNYRFRMYSDLLREEYHLIDRAFFDQLCILETYNFERSRFMHQLQKFYEIIDPEDVFVLIDSSNLVNLKDFTDKPEGMRSKLYKNSVEYRNKAKTFNDYYAQLVPKKNRFIYYRLTKLSDLNDLEKLIVNILKNEN